MGCDLGTRLWYVSPQWDYSNRAFYGKKPETAFRGCYRLPPDCCAHEDCTLRCIQIQSIQYRWNPFARRWRMWWDGTCGQPCCAPNTWCRKLKLLTFLGFFHGTVCVRYQPIAINCLCMTKSFQWFWHVLHISTWCFSTSWRVLRLQLGTRNE